MEYGLRRYEAVQRLRWFVFFLLCLLLAYPVAGSYSNVAPGSPASSFQLNILKSSEFWTQLTWVKGEPLGKAMIFLIWVALLFWIGHALWLAVQYVGKVMVQGVLTAHVPKASPAGARPAGDALSAKSGRLMPPELLFHKINRFPLQFIFHPYQRLRLMLANPQNRKSLSSEDLVEKERRIVETDWQILWGSWAPYRWLLWALPVLALIQSCWLFYQYLQPVLAGHRDIQEVLGTIGRSIFPLVQVIVLTLVFQLMAGLLKRVENLYLSSVDALFYDQFLSRLPFQSSDTIILLEALQRHFHEVQVALRRIEQSVGSDRTERTASGEKS